MDPIEAQRDAAIAGILPRSRDQFDGQAFLNQNFFRSKRRRAGVKQNDSKLYIHNFSVMDILA